MAKVGFGQRVQRTLATPTSAPKPAVPQFQPYAAGRKVYGGGRPAPNVGMTANKEGYGRRDAAVEARKNAFLDRAKRFG